MNKIKMSVKQLKQNLNKIKNAKVLVLGDLGLDKYILGDVKRISPEAPVPVINVQKTYDRLGLSANVAANVKALGAEVELISVIGDDEHGKELKVFLQEIGVNLNIIEDKTRSTTVKTRVIADEQHHVARIDYETKKELSEDIKTQLLQTLKERIDNFDILILEDYAKGLFASKSFTQKIIQIAKENSVPVFVDPSRYTPYDYYEGSSLLKPNKDELKVLANEKDLDMASYKLKKSLGLKYLLLTLGKNGMDLYSDREKRHIDSFALAVYDVSGAGDTVIATLASLVASGLNIEESVYISNLAAATVVAKVGTAIVDIDEVLIFAEEKILEQSLERA